MGKYINNIEYFAEHKTQLTVLQAAEGGKVERERKREWGKKEGIKDKARCTPQHTCSCVPAHVNTMAKGLQFGHT